MAEAGVSRFVIERVLGHSEQGVTASYDRYTYREEKGVDLSILAGKMLT